MTVADWSLVFYLLAVICFVLAAFGVPRLGWAMLGVAFLILGYLVVPAV